MQCMPIYSRIVSLLAESNVLQYAVPGGLIGVGTTVSPSVHLLGPLHAVECLYVWQICCKSRCAHSSPHLPMSCLLLPAKGFQAPSMFHKVHHLRGVLRGLLFWM